MLVYAVDSAKAVKALYSSLGLYQSRARSGLCQRSMSGLSVGSDGSDPTEHWLRSCFWPKGMDSDDLPIRLSMKGLDGFRSV